MTQQKALFQFSMMREHHGAAIGVNQDVMATSYPVNFKAKPPKSPNSRLNRYSTSTSPIRQLGQCPGPLPDLPAYADAPGHDHLLDIGGAARMNRNNGRTLV